MYLKYLKFSEVLRC